MALDPDWTIEDTEASEPSDDEHYIELTEGSGEQQFTGDTSEAVRVFMVEWGSRIDFLTDVLGFSRWENTDLIRILPDRHPDLYLLYADGARVRPAGNTAQQWPDGSQKADYAIVTVTYHYLPYEVFEDDDVPDESMRYTTRLYNTSSEFLTIEGHFQFVTPGIDGKKALLKQSPGRLQPATEMILTWHDVPPNTLHDDEDIYLKYEYPTINIVNELQGKINDSLFQGYEAGTVLFLGAEPRRKRPKVTNEYSPTDQGVLWDIAYKFKVLEHDDGEGGVLGHNSIYNITLTSPRYDLVTSTGDVSGNKIFLEGDLSRLFTIE